MINAPKAKIIKSVLLPGIMPRIRDLLHFNFASLSYLIAYIYNMVRILPNDHPYLRSDHYGRYTIRQAIGAAANHIHFKLKNIDQIVIFFSIIAGLIILAMQFIILLLSVFVPIAKAQSFPQAIPDFFKTANPKEDLAYRFLDIVFGVPELFGSKEEVGTGLHQALQGLFSFYSNGILFVGIIIIIYFIIVVVAETAQSGTPFGQRFNKTWAPIRIILFFFLLIPFSTAHGLNAAQYITLGAAKLGSNVASSGWYLFNDVIESENQTLLGKKELNIAKPKPKNMLNIPAFMMTAKACQISYRVIYNDNDKSGSSIFSKIWKPSNNVSSVTGVQAWAVYKTKRTPTAPYEAVRMESIATFPDLTVASQGNEITIVFGVKDDPKDGIPDLYSSYKGSVLPICGEMVLSVTDVAESGTAIIQQAYYKLIQEMWSGGHELERFAENFTKHHLVSVRGHKDSKAPLPESNYFKEWDTYLNKEMSTAINEAIEKQTGDIENWQLGEGMRDYGWAGAALWYNKIAQQNGALITSLYVPPVPTKYPQIMERIKENNDKNNKNKTPAKDRFTPSYSSVAGDASLLGFELEIAHALNATYLAWQHGILATSKQLTGNAFVDFMNVILGTSQLFEICKSVDIHPLAQLSSVGKELIENSIRSIGFSMGFGVFSISPMAVSLSTTAASSFFSAIAGVGMTLGFVLFYTLPFMPFIYFFFAVGGWVKGIFEAMVAMPLWALAHLRIDGESIPGEAAMSGYYLIFEIFIRPILIIFGLLAAILILSALVRVLNDTYYLTLSTLSGQEGGLNSSCFKDAEDPAGGIKSLSDIYRGPVDEFFFVILYTILCYMLANNACKLIDTIPNNILRWFGADTTAFNDEEGDAAEGLMKYITLGGNQIGGQLGSSLDGVGTGFKKSIQQFMQ